MKKVIALLLTLMLVSLPALAGVPTIFDVLSGKGTEEPQKTETQVMNETIESLKAQVASLSAENQLLKIKENVGEFSTALFKQQLANAQEEIAYWKALAQQNQMSAEAKAELESLRSENANLRADLEDTKSLLLAQYQYGTQLEGRLSAQTGALEGLRQAFQKWYGTLYVVLSAVRDAYGVDELQSWTDPATGEVFDPILPPAELQFTIPEMIEEQ